MKGFEIDGFFSPVNNLYENRYAPSNIDHAAILASPPLLMNGENKKFSIGSVTSPVHRDVFIL